MAVVCSSAWGMLFLGTVACGGAKAGVATPSQLAEGSPSGSASAPGPTPAPASASTPAAALTPSPAPTPAPTPVPAARPFASTALEAQSMIQSAIDDQVRALWKCVEDHRKVNHDAHGSIVVDIGIDQEGTLLGIIPPNPKHPLTPALTECMMTALRGVAFPRSHAGIITVRQTFKDETIQQ